MDTTTVITHMTSSVGFLPEGSASFCGTVRLIPEKNLVSAKRLTSGKSSIKNPIKPSNSNATHTGQI